MVTDLRVRRSVGGDILLAFLAIVGAGSALGMAAMASQRDSIVGVPALIVLTAMFGLVVLFRRQLRLEGNVLFVRTTFRSRMIPLEGLTDCVAPPSQWIGFPPMRMGFLSMQSADHQAPITVFTFMQREADLAHLRALLQGAALENRARGLTISPVASLKPTRAQTVVMCGFSVVALGLGVVFLFADKPQAWLLLGCGCVFIWLTWDQWARGRASFVDGCLSWRDAFAKTHSVPLAAIQTVDDDGKIRLKSGRNFRLASGLAQRGAAQRFVELLRKELA